MEELELVSREEGLKLSFSRLQTYLSCPRKYHYRYVEQVGEAEVTPALLLGVATHSLLESILADGLGVEEAAARVAPQFLEQTCQLGVELAEPLYDICLPYGQLLSRTLPHYDGVDAIRNSDGSSPLDVLAYPSTAWKSELRRYGELMRQRLWLDREAGKQNSLFRQHSLCDVFAFAIAMAKLFRPPSWVKKSLGVELQMEGIPLSPTYPDAYWVGVIDWVVETTDGRICLIDHKTSRNLPAELDVEHHPQLAVYAYMWAYRHERRLPDLVAIHHVRTGKFHVVPVQKELVEEIVDYFVHLYESSLVGLPYRHLPTEYNSPCLRRHYRTQAVIQVCPYLERCWPGYYRRLLDSEGYVLPEGRPSYEYQDL